MFLDLTKTFDTVDYSILCDYLSYHGFQESLFDLLAMQSFVCQTYSKGFCFIVICELSEWGAVPIGVPQGSIQCPLLFALYTNDLPSVITHCYLDLQLHGDDVELHCSHSDLCVVETGLLSDLHLYAVAAWLCSSHLCVNAGKSNFILIGSCQRVQISHCMS